MYASISIFITYNSIYTFFFLRFLSNSIIVYICLVAQSAKIYRVIPKHDKICHLNICYIYFEKFYLFHSISGESRILRNFG